LHSATNPSNFFLADTLFASRCIPLSYDCFASSTRAVTVDASLLSSTMRCENTTEQYPPSLGLPRSQRHHEGDHESALGAEPLSLFRPLSDAGSSSTSRQAKPEALNSGGFGRARRRVTFEAKQSSIPQIAERRRTGGIAAFVDHHTLTTSVRIEIPPMRPRAVFHAAIRSEPSCASLFLDETHARINL